jgi:hypothetical protein
LAAFVFLASRLEKLQTRKVTRKVANFAERNFALTRNQKREMLRISA